MVILHPNFHPQKAAQEKRLKARVAAVLGQQHCTNRSIVLFSAQDGDLRVCSANTDMASKDRWTGDDIHSCPADWTENTSPLENSVF